MNLIFHNFKPELQWFVAVSRFRKIYANADISDIANVVMTEWSTQQILQSSASSEFIRVHALLNAIWVNCSPFIVDSNCLSDCLSWRKLNVQHLEDQVGFTASFVTNENENFLCRRSSFTGISSCCFSSARSNFSFSYFPKIIWR